VRAVVDPNVLISALLSRDGAPARLLHAWVGGAFELIVSPLLLHELRRALGYPKLRKQVPSAEADGFLALLERSAIAVEDPATPAPIHSSDPGDDYLLALAAAQRAALVSGDGHLLSLRDRGLPIDSPAEFLERLPDARASTG
jgi:putative PIN family toxin of toxin-antitoxin system